MAINHDFSDFPESLRQFAIHQILWSGILYYDQNLNSVVEAPDADDKRKALLESDQYGYWAWWMRFSTGFECLIKALFLNHQISLLKKNDLLPKGEGGARRLRTLAAAKVYAFVEMTTISSSRNLWLQQELARLGISHPWELNSQTLGSYKNRLGELTRKSIINPSQEEFLSDAITVLSDIRRNVDAHVFLMSLTGGNINQDLSNVYVPAINLMLKAYKSEHAKY